MSTVQSKKYLNINPNILLEFEYDSANISEPYKIISDLSKNTKGFLSTTNINKIEYNLFPIDLVHKKYSKISTDKFNFLKTQDYFSGVISYDKMTIYFPSSYNFDVYYGFYLKIYAYDYLNKKIYSLSNFYFDKTQSQTIDSRIIYADNLINLATPFVYNQKEWGKYLTFQIPSVKYLSNQRLVSTTINVVEPNSINDHLTNGIGLDPNSLIYFEFSFISSKQTVFDIQYYYLSDTFKMSIPNQPEYQTLGVVIEESTQGDFFEIYGVYKNSNENLDNFVNEQESKGRRINVEYTVTLFEENLQSGFPITFLVTENFAQKIEYRPIIKYSNTTAAIDVEMKIIDLIDVSSFSRFASIGLTRNLLKYGKTLSRLEVGNLSKPKIYNYKFDKNFNFKTTSNKTDVNIIKVPFPILIDTYKILASNYTPNSTSDYKSTGLLNIILTPFDNIIKFQIAKQDSAKSSIIPYDLSEILLNSKLNLVFKSDNKNIEKDIYYQTDENKFSMGIVVFKINQEDIPLLKQINKEKSDNFYIILNSNKTKTLLYSGKFKIFENIKFLNVPTAVPATTVTPAADIVQTTNTLTNLNTLDTTNPNPTNSTNLSGGMNDILPPQFDSDGIPILDLKSRGTLDYYKNLVIWISAGLTSSQVVQVDNSIKDLGLTIFYAYRTPVGTGPIIAIIEKAPIEVIARLKTIQNIINIKELNLDFGWKRSTDTMSSLSSLNPTKTDISTGSKKLVKGDTMNVIKGGGCPTPDMRISKGNNIWIRSGDLIPGSMVYTMHEKTEKWGYYPVILVERMIQFVLSVKIGENIVEVSESHKFLTEFNEYISISDLTVGSVVKTIDGNSNIISIDKIGEKEVIRIEVGDAHTYVVEGIISHNKKITNDDLNPI